MTDYYEYYIGVVGGWVHLSEWAPLCFGTVQKSASLLSYMVGFSSGVPSAKEFSLHVFEEHTHQ